jgi:hypothetical protein
VAEKRSERCIGDRYHIAKGRRAARSAGISRRPSSGLMSEAVAALVVILPGGPAVHRIEALIIDSLDPIVRRASLQGRPRHRQCRAMAI